MDSKPLSAGEYIYLLHTIDISKLDDWWFFLLSTYFLLFLNSDFCTSPIMIPLKIKLWLQIYLLVLGKFCKRCVYSVDVRAITIFLLCNYTAIILKVQCFFKQHFMQQHFHQVLSSLLLLLFSPFSYWSFFIPFSSKVWALPFQQCKQW